VSREINLGSFISTELLALHIGLLEHGEGTRGGGHGSGGLLDTARLLGKVLEGPCAVIVHEEARVLVEASSNDGVVIEELGGEHGEILKIHGLNVINTLLKIDEVSCGTMTEENNTHTVRRPSNGIDPGLGSIELSENLTEDILGVTEHMIVGVILLIDVLIESRHNAALHISRGSDKEARVGGPGSSHNSGFVLLDHLRDPPIGGSFIVAKGNALGTRGDSELLTTRRPTNRDGSTVDTKDTESGLPFLTIILPNISISVMTTSNNMTSNRGPINARNKTGVLQGKRESSRSKIRRDINKDY